MVAGGDLPCLRSFLQLVAKNFANCLLHVHFDHASDWGALVGHGHNGRGVVCGSQRNGARAGCAAGV